VSAPQATDQIVAPPPTEPGRLHRPGRAIVALVEVLVAGLAVWGAFWAWPHGFATIATQIADGRVLESQRVFGNWLAAAIGFGTIAAVLVLDAARQVLLAVRVRPKREPMQETRQEPVQETGKAPEAVPDAGSDTRTAGDD
jgi:hypothetical protein